MFKKLKNQLNPIPDAISLLKQDHREVEALFISYKSTKDKRKQAAIVRKICSALETHTKIEEKIFYPKVKQHKDLAGKINEAVVEHAGAKKLVRELKSSVPTQELYGAKVTVLEEYIRHHVREEEEDLFPKVQDTDLDLIVIGRHLQDAKRRSQQST